MVSLVAVMRRRPERPWAWWLLLVGSATVVLTRAAGSLRVRPLLATSVSPLGDIRALLFYLALAAGLLLVGGRTTRRNLADALDAIIVALGVFLLMWLFLLGGALELSSETPAAAFVRPMAVAVLAGILTRLLFIVEGRTPSFWLLVAAASCGLVGAVVTTAHDLGYPFTTRMYDTGIWYSAYPILVAAALVHPSSAWALSTRMRGVARFSDARVVVFVALTLLGPLAWVAAVVPTPFHVSSLLGFGPPVIIAAAISLLLVLRLALITRVADDLRDELAYRVSHDALTGLANRSELVSQLDAAVGRRGVNGGRAALLLLDLDGFKHVNDAFGHPVGDELLVQVGQRLNRLAPRAGTAIRLGGDEFAVLLSDTDEESALRCAEAVRDWLSQPYQTSQGELSISASVGVCVTPRVEKSSSEVLRDADLALYSAKAAGKNRVRLFDKRPQ